jgi:hypothetical protein
MRTLEEEAEYHYDMTYMMGKDDSLKPYVINDFIAGANSKWVQAEKIKAQISENESVLEMLKVHGNDSSKFRVSMRIDQLRQQLKQLEDESKTEENK